MMKCIRPHIFSRTPCIFDISVRLSNRGHIDMLDMCVSTTFMFPHNNCWHWVVVLIARTGWFNLIKLSIVKNIEPSMLREN